MTKKGYEKEIKKHWLSCRVWAIILFIITLLLGLVIIKSNYINNYYWYTYCVSLVLCLHMILANVQDVRYKSLALARLIEKEKFQSKLKIANNKFYTIFDNMCCNNSSLKSQELCKDLLSPIVPSRTVKKWKRDPFDNTKIIGYWAEDFKPYSITCPHQLRDIVIKLQNSL